MQQQLHNLMTTLMVSESPEDEGHDDGIDVGCAPGHVEVLEGSAYIMGATKCANVIWAPACYLYSVHTKSKSPAPFTILAI